ncbi:MAG: diaminopimelate epimerase, partial [Eubacterium sp.]
AASDVGAVTDKEMLLDETIGFEDWVFTYGCASMGNPHMVVLVDDVVRFPIETVGPYFEKHPMFKNKCNVSFAQIIDRETILMDTWERGVGRTMACGTGTCAAAAVLHKMGLVEHKIRACLSGGDLTIESVGDVIFMTGPAQVVFTGDIELDTPSIEDNLLSAVTVYGAERLGGR